MSCFLSTLFLLTRVSLLLLAGLALAANAGEATAPPGPFTEAECIDCHTGSDPELVRQWRNGPHRSTACGACHGDRHASAGQGAAERARQDSACTGCHAGPASHSYVTSKHGVIRRLEAARQDDSKPLRRGNYRSPGCSYCHLHDNEHGDSMSPTHGPERVRGICGACHGPRYVTEQLASGVRQLALADLKLAEGEALIGQAGASPDETLEKLHSQLQRHRDNVLLGIGHQSPDYQWWHGQPALDGDLIQIREALASARYQALTDSRQAGVEHTRDPETGLESWSWQEDGIAFTFNQRLPDQSRAYFQGRGFQPGEADTVALACVFQVVVRNDADAPVELDLSGWQVIPAGGSPRPPRLEADWQQEWQRLEVAQPARIAFRWSLFPTHQQFQPGDWNMGMVTFDLEPDAMFDLEVNWHHDKKARQLRFEGMRCAPDRQL